MVTNTKDPMEDPYGNTKMAKTRRPMIDAGSGDLFASTCRLSAYRQACQGRVTSNAMLPTF